MKDECAGSFISEAICLRAKCYSLSLTDGTRKQTLKGVQKCVVEKEIDLEDYRQVMTTNVPQYHTMRVIRSKNHVLYRQELDKISLSIWDDKRYVLDHRRTLPFGHKDIPSSSPQQS